MVERFSFHLRSRFTSLWRLLTEPHAAISDPALRSRARLLSGLLVGFILITGVSLLLFATPAEGPTEQLKPVSYEVILILGLVLLLGNYFLSRSRYYKIAALALILLATLLIFFDIVTARESNLDIAYLIFGVLLSSLFFSRRTTALILAATMAGVLLLPQLSEGISLDTVGNAETFLVVIGMLIITISFMRQKDHERLASQEAALLTSEEKYRRLVNEINDGIFETDAQGIITFANLALARIYGVGQPQAMIGRNFLDFIVPESLEKTRKDFLQFLDKRQVYEVINLDVIRPDGAQVNVEGRPVLVIQDGQVMGMRGVLRDITMRKQAENELRQAHNLLEQRVAERTEDLQTANLALAKASRMKDEFLASMSHELRTPLTSILGLSEALQLQTYGALSDKQITALKQVEISGRNLLEMINNTLDYAMIEAGRLSLQPADCPVLGVCQNCLQAISKPVEEKHLRVSLDIEAEAMYYVRADLRRLRQILGNLLSNAVRFTPEGGSLGIEVCTGADDSQVKITVWDNGIGISKQDLPRLFQPFIRLDDRLERQHFGLGLGLVLAGRLAELQGGSISVESSLGAGSRFSVSLPRA